jgi:hypothetical protein
VTEGNLELLQVIVSWVVTVPAVATILVVDEHRLRGEELARAWPSPSRDAAIFGVWLGVPPLCVVVHFVRTRRTVGAFLHGLGWFFTVIAADLGAQVAAAALVDWLGL